MGFSGASVRSSADPIRGSAHTVRGSAPGGHSAGSHACRSHCDPLAPLAHPSGRRRRGEAAAGRDQQGWTGSSMQYFNL